MHLGLTARQAKPESSVAAGLDLLDAEHVPVRVGTTSGDPTK